jgi:hypothetical protein
VERKRMEVGGRRGVSRGESERWEWGGVEKFFVG